MRKVSSGIKTRFVISLCGVLREHRTQDWRQVREPVVSVLGKVGIEPASRSPKKHTEMRKGLGDKIQLKSIGML